MPAKDYPTTTATHRHAETLNQADQIEARILAGADLFDAASDLGSIADGIGSGIVRRINQGIEPDAQDLATLYYLEGIARRLNDSARTASVLTGVDPLELIRKHLHLAVYRWIPRD